MNILEVRVEINKSLPVDLNDPLKFRLTVNRELLLLFPQTVIGKAHINTKAKSTSAMYM